MNSKKFVPIFWGPKLRSYFGTGLTVALGMFLVVGDSSFAQAANARSGLDARPMNSTCVAPEPPPAGSFVNLKKVFTSLVLEHPAAMVQPPRDSSIWVFAERSGKIRIFDNDLNVRTDIVALDLERKFENINRAVSGPNVESQQWGITSIALDPAFDVNGYLYIAYNTKVAKNGPVFSFVSRFTLAESTLTFDPTTEKIILSLPQDKPLHHLGQIAFGQDGLFYIGSGDGTLSPSAQDVDDLHGKILRIDVHSGDPYSIPLDNPFAGGGGAREIFAWGFRNPWRFSFDRETGELFVGDVGDRTFEEVDLVELGKNYGWPILEGTQCVIDGCDQSGLAPPIHEYLHNVGRAVIGGFTYRGNAIPDLEGIYVFGDTSSGLWKLEKDGDDNWFREDVLKFGVTSFAQDNEGELYFFNVSREGVFKIVPQARIAQTVAENVLANLLSETGCVNPSDPTLPATGMLPYSVNARLWSDGADKNRWLGLPGGEKITIDASGDLHFPIGTVLMKNFAFEGKPFETRLFMRHPNGEWAGYSYEWKDDLSDAFLLAKSKNKQLPNGIMWSYPGRTQCLECHTAAAGFTLGPEIAQLNRKNYYPSTDRTASQITTWDKIGLFEGGLGESPINLPALYRPEDTWVSIHLRARSYLHANCSGCHRPDGPAQGASDLRYDIPIDEMNICDILPTASVGERVLYPGDPSKSAISIRTHTLGTERMPPLGTGIVDRQGAALIDNWILDPEVCTVGTDSDGDGIADHMDNCQFVANVDQQDEDKDGYGNLCDGDLNNDGTTNTLDLNVYRSVHRSNIGDFNYAPEADFNSDGAINTLDLHIYESLHRILPGPSCCGVK